MDRDDLSIDSFYLNMYLSLSLFLTLVVSSIFSCSILNYWLHPTITMKMLPTNQMVLPWCGTSNLRRLHQSTSFTVRYFKPLNLHLNFLHSTIAIWGVHNIFLHCSLEWIKLKFYIHSPDILDRKRPVLKRNWGLKGKKTHGWLWR